MCDHLPDPDNGNVVFNGTTVGSVAKYSCITGYVLKGQRSRKCLSNGVWSGSAPICKSEWSNKSKKNYLTRMAILDPCLMWRKELVQSFDMVKGIS